MVKMGRENTAREKENFSFLFFQRRCFCFSFLFVLRNLAQWLLHAMALAGEASDKKKGVFAFFILRFSLL